MYIFGGFLKCEYPQIIQKLDHFSMETYSFGVHPFQEPLFVQETLGNSHSHGMLCPSNTRLLLSSWYDNPGGLLGVRLEGRQKWWDRQQRWWFNRFFYGLGVMWMVKFWCFGSSNGNLTRNLNRLGGNLPKKNWHHAPWNQHGARNKMVPNPIGRSSSRLVDSDNDINGFKRAVWFYN